MATLSPNTSIKIAQDAEHLYQENIADDIHDVMHHKEVFDTLDQLVRGSEFDKKREQVQNIWNARKVQRIVKVFLPEMIVKYPDEVTLVLATIFEYFNIPTDEGYGFLQKKVKVLLLNDIQKNYDRDCSERFEELNASDDEDDRDKLVKTIEELETLLDIQTARHKELSKIYQKQLSDLTKQEKDAHKYVTEKFAALKQTVSTKMTDEDRTHRKLKYSIQDDLREKRKQLKEFDFVYWES